MNLIFTCNQMSFDLPQLVSEKGQFFSSVDFDITASKCLQHFPGQQPQLYGQKHLARITVVMSVEHSSFCTATLCILQERHALCKLFITCTFV